jgi:hypothetical protein
MFMHIAEYTPPIDLHNELNPDLWNGEDLRPEVRFALLKIAKEYYAFLDINVPIIDLVVSGSQANYNYTKYSDLDLHLVVAYSKVQCDVEVDKLFDAKRRLWKDNHTIMVHNIPVELYAEDVNKPAVSATYSVIKGEWIKRPDAPILDYDEEEVMRLVQVWERVINSAVDTGNLEICKKVKDMLKVFRQAGLDKDGEYGSVNLAFKSLRNDGMVGKLMSAIVDLTDKDLSI